MSHRFEGHNLEDALKQAAAALGVDRWQLSYRVLVEKRGFLGGIKRIVIEAEVNEAATEPPQPMTNESRPVVPPAPVAARGTRGQGRSGGREARGQGRGDRERGDRERGERETRRGGRGRAPRREEEPPPESLEPAENIPEQGEQSEAAALVADWCHQVLSMAKLSVDVRTVETEQNVTVRLYGADARRFVDNHGELLDALQVLANKALVGRKIEKEIELDCRDFKEQRVSDLGEQAREAADRVRQDRSEQLLPAMSPIERRIVHVALQDDPDVTTESRGEGFYKRVAIVLRPAAPAADESRSEP
jgi:spoIIIJ-associated protein